MGLSPIPVVSLLPGVYEADDLLGLRPNLHDGVDFLESGVRLQPQLPQTLELPFRHFLACWWPVLLDPCNIIILK